MVPAEVRAHIAATLTELTAFVALLATQLLFPEALTIQQSRALVQETEFLSRSSIYD
jgi:hypothetical protein